MPFEDYMLALAEAQTRGHARLIGVSNFPIALLERTERLLGPGAIATNQVEIHPYMQAPKLAANARSKGLPLTAYQPLCRGAVASDPVLQSDRREAWSGGLGGRARLSDGGRPCRHSGLRQRGQSARQLAARDVALDERRHAGDPRSAPRRSPHQSRQVAGLGRLNWLCERRLS